MRSRCTPRLLSYNSSSQSQSSITGEGSSSLGISDWAAVLLYSDPVSCCSVSKSEHSWRTVTRNKSWAQMNSLRLSFPAGCSCRKWRCGILLFHSHIIAQLLTDSENFINTEYSLNASTELLITSWAVSIFFPRILFSASFLSISIYIEARL